MIFTGYGWYLLLRVFHFSGAIFIVIPTPVQTVLLLRTWAVWERSSFVARILVLGATLSEAHYVAVVVCSVQLTKAYRYIPNVLVDTLTECYRAAVAVSPSHTTVKIMFGSLDGMIFTLMLTKAIFVGE
ncbi:hypothetical protein BD410DRAFT_493343 [Rickenella mellea]|uniref:Uncharacterized protein n=1 Tax=Rickenella mellea TaxID=50990 RepID=A0A4Y7PU65_9AGAM|nr:hypothetical protein BD410DRAFT_493343 [Rickenella mellea]